MSELQTVLLVIGFGVIVAVYAFGWWQQRRYRRKFGATFKASHADALYQENTATPVQQVQQPDLAETAEKNITTDHYLDETADELVEKFSAVELAPAAQPVAEASTRDSLDESCALIDMRSDFIIELHLAEPGPAAVLDGLWQRKFDFGKPVQVCGLTLNTQQWERAIAESQTLYVRFRIALQLVDRGGAISVAKLADFRDLVLGLAKKIKADTTVPKLNETHHHAVELDKVCEQ